MLKSLADIPSSARYDVIVLGGGAAGLAAALIALIEGRCVLLVERTEYVGGTSALLAATTWVPGTRHGLEVGSEDTLEAAAQFLDAAVGNRSPRALREAFLAAGPEAIHTLEDRGGLKFRARPFHPDYLADLPGATTHGRALEPTPFDGRLLGKDLCLIRPPIPEFTVLNGMMVDRDDIAHLLKFGRSGRSTLHAICLFIAYGMQRLRHGRGTRLLMGNALIGQLLYAAREQGLHLMLRTEVTNLMVEGDAMTGITITQDGATRDIHATGGVVLASGGFTQHPSKRQSMLPSPAPLHSPAAPGNTGRLHDMAERLGAHYGVGADQPCFWAPVSHRQRSDGSIAVFPHFVFDRSKPGIIAVGRDGRRFVNESTSYHLFVSAMYAANREGTHIPVWLVADARALSRYGMGMIRPGGAKIAPFLADGYLTVGSTSAELAAKIGVDPDGLADSIARMNTFAAVGKDDDFARGSTVYERANGDPTHGPNPTLGSLETPPYYAVRLWPSDIGAAAGLVTDTKARVLRRDGSTIMGLYACGNDMQTIMGGVYPGPGITIGPAIVFGFLAARDAAARARLVEEGNVSATQRRNAPLRHRW